MSTSGFLVLAALLPVALGQLVGTNIAENHPTLTWQRCNRTGGMRRRISLEGHSRSFPQGTSCTTQSIDSNWLWTHQGTSGRMNWYTELVSMEHMGQQVCFPVTCLGTSSWSLPRRQDLRSKLRRQWRRLVSQQPNISSCVYLMAPGSTTTYQTFNVNNQEFVSLSAQSHFF
ncbi:hypothetical protein B0H14DRAFT_3128353, partial [Mycena olivaceomarginata]